MRISRRFIRLLFTSFAWWLGVAVSIVLYSLAERMVEDKAQALFDYQASNAQLAIEARLQSYIDVLRGVNALFYTADHIGRDQFRTYVDKLRIAETFPGITNLNFARQVPAHEKKAFESLVRSDTSVDRAGYPDFSISPPRERDEYHVLTYVEPMETNLVSFGFDLGSNDRGTKALALSRDSGELISSGRLLHIGGPNGHVGLAMRMPLYRRGMPAATVEEKRAAYYGSVGAGFDVNKVMLGAINRAALPHMRLRLHDTGYEAQADEAATATPAQMLFDSAMAHGGQGALTTASAPDEQFIKRVSMTVGSRVWEAEFSASKAAMRTAFDAYLPWLVMAVGLLSSLLLYSIYYSLATARTRAVELAREMTKDLRESEASLAEAQQMAQLGSWLLEPESGRMTWSAETWRLFGMDRFENPAYEDFLRRICQEDRKRIREALQAATGSGKEFRAEHRINRRDGATRWVQTIVRPSLAGGRKRLRGTIMDITERKETMEALEQSKELLHELTAHQDRVKEEERRRIAREIHDELGQTLLALRIDVAMLEARTGQTHPRLNEKVRGALHYIDATVKTIRTIINNLRPAVLDLGLTAAIEWQVAEFRRRTGIACDLVMSDKEFAVDDVRATALFRVLQESLTNVIRHANANHVLIELYAEDEQLVMKVSDNGVGIYRERRKNDTSFGLIGVEERIHALNGRFIINSGPGKGTVLEIHIPLSTAAREAVTHPA